MLRSLDELLATDDPAWPLVEEWVAASGGAAVVIAPDPAHRGEALHALQVSARSTLGALAYHSGGIVVDGWMRLLGGFGVGVTANLISWNPTTGGGSPPWLTIGFDALGGVFAIDGGGLGVAPGKVCYFAPDNLEWESLDLGHTALVETFLTDSTARDHFFGERWPTWREDAAALAFDQAFSVVPPPWTAEGRDLAKASRRAVPAKEVIDMAFDVARQLASMPKA